MFNILDNLGGIACHDGVGRHILCHYGIGTDNAAVAHRHSPVQKYFFYPFDASVILHDLFLLIGSVAVADNGDGRYLLLQFCSFDGCCERL